MGGGRAVHMNMYVTVSSVLHICTVINVVCDC